MSLDRCVTSIVDTDEDVKMPTRIQRKRTKGWKMPENTVYVGRPTKWGNHFGMPDDPFHDTAENATKAYRWFIEYRPDAKKLRDAAKVELRGKNLCCWCPLDKDCHADVLLELANRPHERGRAGGA